MSIAYTALNSETRVGQNIQVPILVESDNKIKKNKLMISFLDDKCLNLVYKR